MTQALKNTLQENLEVKCSNMGNCIVALNAQGYLVNATKWWKVRMNLILQQQIKYINSFSSDVENRVINLFNRCS